MKLTKKALVLSLLAMLLCVSMLIGTTFAWFTDTATSSNNRIVAGNLDVDLVMYNGTDYVSIAGGSGDIFDTAAIAQNKPASLWEPGKTQIVYLGVQNKGNLAIKYNIILDVTDTDTTDGVNLADVLDFAIIDGAKAGDTNYTYANWAAVTNATSTTGVIGTLMGTSNPARITAAQNGTLDEIRKGTQNETNYFVLAVHMQETAGNEYQGKEIVIDLSVVATQKDAEEDSFGPEYDEPATLPEVPVAIHDIVTRTIAAAPVAAATSTATVVAATEITSTDATSTVPAVTTVTLTGYTASGEDKTDSVTGLTRTIETTDSSVTSLTLDIGYKATVTTTANNVVVGTEEYAVHTFGNVVENIVNVGTGLTNVKVTHGTTQMTKANNTTAKADGTYYYDSETGKLYIWSSTYSEYSVSWDAPDYVASVGSTGYTSLDAALAAAKEGDTVTLLKSVSGQAAILVSKSLTINGNGNTITFSGNRGIRVSANDVDLTVKNVTLVGGSNFERALQIDSDKTGVTFNINNVNATATLYTVNICAGVTVELNITNSKLYGWAALNIWSDGVTIDATNSTLNGLNDKTYDADGWNNFCTICLEGDTTGSTPLHASDMTITLTNCTVTATATTGNKQSLVGFNHANSGGALNNIVEMTGCTLSIDNEDDLYYDNGTKNQLIIGSSTLNGKAFSINYETPTPDTWYSNGAFNTTKTGGMDTFFATPFEGGWMDNGEGVILTDNVTLSANVTCQMTSGSFSLYFDGHTISGGKIVINYGVSVISDTNNMQSVFAVGDSTGVGLTPAIIVSDNGNGTYTYSVGSSFEAGGQGATGGPTPGSGPSLFNP